MAERGLINENDETNANIIVLVCTQKNDIAFWKAKTAVGQANWWLYHDFLSKESVVVVVGG